MRIVSLALCLVVLSACVSSSTSNEVNEWSLVELRLDSAAAHNRGVLPLWRTSDVSEFGQAPRARGKLTMTSAGRVVVDVLAEEPILTLGGQSTVQTYMLLGFFGALDSSGAMAVQQDAAAMRAPLGVGTVLKIDRQGSARIVMQAFTGAKPLPYVYVFERGASPQAAVFVPLLPQ